MPRELYDKEGNPIEVPNEDEIKTWQDSATKVEDLNNQITGLNESRDKLESVNKELEENQNPNWKEARDKISNLEKERDEAISKAKEAGIEIGEKAPSAEEIEKISTERANKVFLERYRDSKLRQYGERAVEVAGVFNKLSSGEELTEDKIDELIQNSARTLGLDRENMPENTPGSGFQPKPGDLNPGDKKDYAASEDGQDMMKRMEVDEKSLKRDFNLPNKA